MAVGIGRNSTSSPMLMTELIIDTASGFTWLQGFPCDSCYEQGNFPYYNSSASKSFDPVYCTDEICQIAPYEAHVGCSDDLSQPLYERCSYNVQYYDGTNSSGVIGTETFYFLDTSLLGNVHLEFVPFGVGTSNYFTSRKLSSPGVAGFARGYGTLLDKLGVKKFSHCFPREEDDTGTMSFGDEAMIKGVKLALNGESERYEAPLTNLYVSGERVVVEYDYVLPANMVFDTGTSWTYLTAEIVDAIVGVIKNVLRKYQPRKWGDNELCYNMTDLSYVSLDEVAKVTFEFNYATRIDLFSYNLWLRINEINLICLGFVKGEENVFGNNLMREMNIGYTLDKDDFAMYFNRQHCLK
ncbi:aspartyl protease UND-like [Chenopodium quinoa]|nr:aspartyl protease UND-like [Chenopodium quinoa]